MAGRRPASPCRPGKRRFAPWPKRSSSSPGGDPRRRGRRSGLHVKGRENWRRTAGGKLARLARGPRGSGWAPSGSASSWECRATRSRKACAEQAQEPSWGIAKGGHFDHAVGQVSAFLKLCKTPPCQTFTPSGTLLSRRRPGPGAPAGSAGAAGPSPSAEDAPTPGTKPRAAQCEMAPRTFSIVRIIFAFSSLSKLILAALADSASPMSAPRAATAQAIIAISSIVASIAHLQRVDRALVFRNLCLVTTVTHKPATVYNRLL